MNLLATNNTTDFYLTPKGQIVRFDFKFKPETVFPELHTGHKNRPIATKQCDSTVRGKFLRNGRCFTTVADATNYLTRYLYANGFISLSAYRNKTGLKG